MPADINRRSNEIDPRYHEASDQPRREERFAAAFVFARASDTRRHLIAGQYRAHGEEDASIYGEHSSWCACVNLYR